MNRRWIVVALIFLSILISYVDRGNLSIAADSIMRDFQLPPASMGVLLSAFFWTYAFCQLPAGYIVDRYGIRFVYAAGFVLWSLASAGMALSRHAGDIIALRMLLGLAEAVAPLASLAFIRQNFSGREQGLPTATTSPDRTSVQPVALCSELLCWPISDGASCSPSPAWARSCGLRSGY